MKAASGLCPAVLLAGAPDFNLPAPQPAFIPMARVIRRMVDDLCRVGERERRFTRYVIFTHLFNAGLSADQLRSYRHGLVKLVNSLSCLAKELGTLKVEGGTVQRQVFVDIFPELVRTLKLGVYVELKLDASATLIRRGDTLLHKGDRAGAIRAYTEAITTDPDGPLAYHKRAAALHAQREFDRAIADYTAVLRLNPRSVTAYNNRGFSYYEQEQYDKAIVDFSAAIMAGRDQEPPGGLLTAGSFDDNVYPEPFRTFVSRLGQDNEHVGALPGKFLGRRLEVVVRGRDGKPVGNARVSVKPANGGKAVNLLTRTDGRAIVLTSWDQIASDENLAVTVTPPDGSAAVKQIVPRRAARWQFDLPAVAAPLPKKLDLVLVLDTTGSMGDELEYLKSEVKSIVTRVKKQHPDVDQRYGLVLYRDDGDDYVTRVFPFTSSLSVFREHLSAQSAAGGGDYPEAMHRGLEEATGLQWRDGDTARVLFLVADAPPHSQFADRTMTAIDKLRKEDGGGQGRWAAQAPLTQEQRSQLDEIIRKAAWRARPRLPRAVKTLAEARKLGVPNTDLGRGMTWAREYKGWFVFAYEAEGKPILSFYGIAVRKGTRNVAGFGTW